MPFTFANFGPGGLPVLVPPSATFIPAGSTIYSVTLAVDSPFDGGPGTVARVGNTTNDQLLMSDSDSVLTFVFAPPPPFLWGGPSAVMWGGLTLQVLVTLNNTLPVTTGAARVLVTFGTPLT